MTGTTLRLRRWLGGIISLIGLSGEGWTAPVLFKPVMDEAQRVVIVANANDADSVELAHYYAGKRNIPVENIITLELPSGEEINWREFVTLLQDPLQRRLLERGWIDAIVMNLRDEAGRRKLSVSGHKISYLVTCRGVPLKIRQTEDIPRDGSTNAAKAFQTHHAAVDSELALIATSGTKLDGFVQNPKFMAVKPKVWEPDTLVRVSRLDGPTFSAIRQMIDSALVAEKQGLIGRALVDIGGPHKLGDKWFGETADEFEREGWNLSVDRDRKSLAATARVDNVAWYLGWYEGSVNGPFKLPGFKFAPGAVTLHLHSFSAKSLRLVDGGGWSGPLVARGAAANFGNVYEPYLEYTHQPQLIVRALLGGATLGEAAYYSIPVLSWQGIVLGDPLYRPLKISLPEQWERRAELSGREGSYVALHRIAAALEAGEPDLEAILKMAESAMKDYPSLALAVSVAEMKEAMGDRAGANRELGLAAYLRSVKTDDWGLMAEVARRLADGEDALTAVRVWEGLFKQDLPDAVRLPWLKEAVEVAKLAREFSIVMEWELEIVQLSPP